MQLAHLYDGDFDKVQEQYKPGTLLKLKERMRVRVFDSENSYYYETLDSGEILLLYKVPAVALEEMKVRTLAFEMLWGTKLIKFLCYVDPDHLFEKINNETEE